MKLLISASKKFTWQIGNLLVIARNYHVIDVGTLFEKQKQA